MHRFDMNNKSSQQQAIVRARDNENALIAKDSKKRNMCATPEYKHAIFMRLGINPSGGFNGEKTIEIYKTFCLSHSSVWFSTDSLHKGMSLKKVTEFNNAIAQGYEVEIYFAIGNIGDGENQMEYKAKVLKVESKKDKTPTPDRALTPNEFVDDLKQIWIDVNEIKKTSLTTDDFIVISSRNVLTQSIEKSQFHFGYIQKI